MIEVMFLGEGGHGSVVAAKLLAKAAANSGFKSQSFASYGALRRGGKVEGYVRISEEDLLLRSKMYASDYLVIMDDSLSAEAVSVGAVKKSGTILMNTAKAQSEYPPLSDYNLYTVDAYGIARKKGLVIPGGMPVINTTLLGALTGLLNGIPIENLIASIKEDTPKPDINAECALEGFNRITTKHATGTKTAQPLADDVTAEISIGKYPIYIPEKMSRCNRCQICYMVCPALAITFETDPFSLSVNKKICTACGICIHECPRKAIEWEGN